MRVRVHPLAQSRLKHIDVNLLALSVIHEAASALGETLRPIDGHPVGRPITRAAESFPVDEGLGQTHLDLILLPPVVAQTHQALRQDRRGQVRHPNPGRNQEPHVIDHAVQPLPALRRHPTDQPIPTLQVAHRRLPSHHSDQVSAAARDQVPETGSYQAGGCQIVIPVQELAPLPPLAQRPCQRGTMRSTTLRDELLNDSHVVGGDDSSTDRAALSAL